jgi:hypothetical protein
MKKKLFTVTHSNEYTDETKTKVAYTAFEAGEIAIKDFGVERQELKNWIETKESAQDRNVFECGSNSVIIQKHTVLDNKLENDL